MKKNIFPLLLLIALFSFGSGAVYACSCLAPATDDLRILVTDAHKNSTAVFSGEVVEIVEKDVHVEVKFRIEKSWKGGVKDVIIRTGFNSGDCGFQFVEGKKYLVYASGEKNNLRTNLCTRTALLDSNKDTKILDKIKTKKRKIKSSPK